MWGFFSLSGEIVPIHGQSLSGSYDRNQGIKALHLVTAWAGGSPSFGG
ncbi:hypothetical protein MICAI_1540010 [Microcystis sp. T1-4]|nr:hypothetical protein MICAI_1540010 [Microcystis sp. T1-4]